MKTQSISMPQSQAGPAYAPKRIAIPRISDPWVAIQKDGRFVPYADFMQNPAAYAGRPVLLYGYLAISGARMDGLNGCVYEFFENGKPDVKQLHASLVLEGARRHDQSLDSMWATVVGEAKVVDGKPVVVIKKRFSVHIWDEDIRA